MKYTFIERGKTVVETHALLLKDENGYDWFLYVIFENNKFKEIKPSTLSIAKWDALSAIDRNELMGWAHKLVVAMDTEPSWYEEDRKNN